MESRVVLFYLVTVGLACIAFYPSLVEGGCRDIGVCCKGKNISCRAPGARQNSPTSRICFCDEYCTNLGDCCTDYNRICRAVDCRLGDWGRWEDCDKECGWGKRSRRRPVLQDARNGGEACDKTVESSSCYGYNCKKQQDTNSGRHELRETGKIIPAMYGTWRNDKLYDPYSDIRRNLFFHYQTNKIINRPPYCAHFEISESRHGCSGRSATDWSRMLTKGTTACVECQQFAMKHKLGVRCKGHGVFEKETRWTAFTVPGCHGKWTMKSHHQECTCNPTHQLSFILV